MKTLLLAAFLPCMLAIAPSSSVPDNPISFQEIPAYAALTVYFTGCTAKLQRWADGTITWAGCPTSTCGSTKTCAPFSFDDGSMACLCSGEMSEFMLCMTKVEFSPDGLVSSWDCWDVSCSSWTPEPPAPIPYELPQCFEDIVPVEPGIYYVCDCDYPDPNR